MLGVLVLAEIAGWQVLRLCVASISATLILFGINLVIVALFGALAARSSPAMPRERHCGFGGRPSGRSFAAAVPIATTLLGLARRGGRRRSVFRLFSG
jgi:hypothetical protein